MPEGADPGDQPGGLGRGEASRCGRCASLSVRRVAGRGRHERIRGGAWLVRRAGRRRRGRGSRSDGRTSAAVAEICRRLDGIPLAIELAAARVAAMTPGGDRGHLDERFRLLTGGRRSRVERHQTLRATVEWSYSLLDANGTVRVRPSRRVRRQLRRRRGGGGGDRRRGRALGRARMLWPAWSRSR